MECQGNITIFMTGNKMRKIDVDRLSKYWWSFVQKQMELGLFREM